MDGPLTFFFDRCFGKRLPQLLERLDTPFAVEFHDHKKHGFNDQTPDDEWLGRVGREDWIVFSHDKRFHLDSMARLAVQQHNVARFYVDGATLKLWDKLVLFVKSYDRIRKVVGSESRPFIYRINHQARVYPIKW